MGFDEEGGGSFDGLTPEEQQRFKDRVNSIAQGYAEALKLYEDLFKDLTIQATPLRAYREPLREPAKKV